MDFEGARRNADERLNQELIRIRNLPKRSKIKIANKYGLTHASHTNAGLLKSLEIDLNVISREQRRVANECNKRQREFTEVQKKSLSKFLTPLVQEEGQDTSTVQGNNQRQRKTTDVIDRTPMWLKGRKESMCELKREMLLDLTARSKDKTYKIISKNNKKTSIGAVLPPIRDIEVELDRDRDAWISRLNRQRKNAFTGSCFPFLLAENREYHREEVKHARKPPYQDQQEACLPSNHTENDNDGFRNRTFRGTVYKKILKIPDPAKIPHLDPRDPKLYHVVMKARKRKASLKLEQADSFVARKNTVFTKHWK
ncbi:uncharacterized protein LOC111343336 [Stylophora pistillata]|uniref:Uncharacterized protein n=1 Tax=Stylophora pistillata TaxID=50429 RepID=A0A2B4REM1_STYPI|nr:uncharacterized protein LOC111343336 [Stylophora pistillata]PFX15606.1 hypothetical protein AWC38_SpisGene20172 [Stylophora pistillata]